jgi:hypothetical protein
VAFAVLAMLAALAYGGFRLGNGVTSWLFGIGAPVIAAVVWGAFIAPKAGRRLSGAARVALELVLFGTAAVLLAAAGQPWLAVVLAVVAVVTSVLNEAQERTVGLPGAGTPAA